MITTATRRGHDAARTATATTCRSCGTPAVHDFFVRDRVPVHSSLLLETRDAAVAFPRGELRLGRCDGCGFVQNSAFDPALVHYGPGYEDSQAGSPRFLRFATDLADDLIATYQVRGRTVVEVGSGKGDFLALLSRHGDNRGIGYDPATDPGEVPDVVEHRREPFTAHTPVEPFALLACRHTLEHVDDVSAFVAVLAGHLRRNPGSVGYLEVPDVDRVLREGAFWDLYYEHCSYFTTATLRDLLERHGLRILRDRLGFDGQYVQVDVTTAGGSPSAPADRTEAADPTEAASDVADAVRSFDAQVGEAEQRWRSRVEGWRAAARRVVLWGASSKAVALLTTLGLDDDIDAVVDINPRKHGRFLPGSGHEVLAPAQLVDRPPDVVVAMNPVYLTEIRDDLAARSLFPEVLAA